MREYIMHPPYLECWVPPQELCRGRGGGGCCPPGPPLLFACVKNMKIIFMFSLATYFYTEGIQVLVM